MSHKHILFVKTSNVDKFLIVSLYVDDIMYTGNDDSMSHEFKKSMMRKFDMTDWERLGILLELKCCRVVMASISAKRNMLQMC